MHELSIAQSLIEAASEAATGESSDLELGTARVTKLNVRIGLLAGVVKEALLFSFQLAAEGTLCDSAELLIEEVPVSVHCRQCRQTKQTKGAYQLACPDCGTPSGEIVAGQELELVSIEIETTNVAESETLA